MQIVILPQAKSATLCLFSFFFTHNTHITLYPQELSLSSHEDVLHFYTSVLTVAIWHFLGNGCGCRAEICRWGQGPQATDR